RGGQPAPFAPGLPRASDRGAVGQPARDGLSRRGARRAARRDAAARAGAPAAQPGPLGARAPRRAPAPARVALRALARRLLPPPPPEPGLRPLRDGVGADEARRRDGAVLHPGRARRVARGALPRPADALRAGEP